MTEKPEGAFEPEARINEQGKPTLQCYRCENWFEVEGTKHGVYTADKAVNAIKK